MGYGLLNLGSLFLGLVAWALPVVMIISRSRLSGIGAAGFSLASVGACSVSLFLQIVYYNHLVKIEDWSAVMDTSWAVVRASAILLVITLVLNGALWVRCARAKHPPTTVGTLFD